MAGTEFGGSHVIDIDDLFVSPIERRNHRSLPGRNCENRNGTLLIHKIESTSISDEGKKYCEPNILSIGPYHYGKQPTRMMQIMKYECLEYILKMNQDKKLKDYMEAIMGMENQVRNCYGDEIEMDRNSFLKMLLLDGCFIIHSLCGITDSSPLTLNKQNEGIKMKTYENEGEFIIDMESLELHESQQNVQIKQEDNSYHIKWYFDLFSTDLLLLGNQIPFFVITKIYEIATSGSNGTSILIGSIAEFIEGMINCYPETVNTFDRPKDFHHMLHLCHMYFKPRRRNFETRRSLNQEESCWHGATEYNKTGICFKKREFRSENPHSLLDIEYSDGTMEIPCLNIDHNTACLFRNLIAFEQTCPEVGNHVTAYVVFLSQLINMPNDATLLTKKGIILHQLNSDAEVCDIFAKLTDGVVFNFNDDCYLNSIYYEMQAHHRRNKPKSMTWFGEVASKFSKALSIVT